MFHRLSPKKNFMQNSFNPTTQKKEKEDTELILVKNYNE